MGLRKVPSITHKEKNGANIKETKSKLKTIPISSHKAEKHHQYKTNLHAWPSHWIFWDVVDNLVIQLQSHPTFGEGKYQFIMSENENNKHDEVKKRLKDACFQNK